MKRTNSYLLSINWQRPERQLIYSRKPKFRVSVCFEDRFDFTPDRGAVRFYATIHERPVVFEAPKMTAANGKAILKAIQWYANYIGAPNLELSVDEPGRLKQTISNF